jgi:hypothetical protein
MNDNKETTLLMTYIWNLFTIFGGNFSYLPTEMHDIITQKIPDFDKHFEYEITKQNGSKAILRKGISRLTDTEKKQLGQDIVDFAKNSYNGFKLPSYEEYLANKEDYDDGVSKLSLIINTFV